MQGRFPHSPGDGALWPAAKGSLTSGGRAAGRRPNARREGGEAAASLLKCHGGRNALICQARKPTHEPRKSASRKPVMNNYEFKTCYLGRQRKMPRRPPQ